jgi:hypothetical protein
MLATTRRSILGTTTPARLNSIILFSSQFVIGSSRDLDCSSFSTNAIATNGIKTRPSKAILLEKSKKLGQKRELRAVKKLKEEARIVEESYDQLDKSNELNLKKITAEVSSVTRSHPPLFFFWISIKFFFDAGTRGRT